MVGDDESGVALAVVAVGLAGAGASDDAVVAGAGVLAAGSLGPEQPTVTATAAAATPMAKVRTNELVERCMKGFLSGVGSADYVNRFHLLQMKASLGADETFAMSHVIRRRMPRVVNAYWLSRYRVPASNSSCSECGRTASCPSTANGRDKVNIASSGTVQPPVRVESTPMAIGPVAAIR